MTEVSKKTTGAVVFWKSKPVLVSAIVIGVVILLFVFNTFWNNNPYPGVPKRAIALYKDGVEAIEKNDPEKALNALTTAITLDNTFADALARTAEAYFMAAMKHKAAKNTEMKKAMLEQSQVFINRALAADFENGLAHLVMGYHAYENNKIDEAIKELETAEAASVHTFQLHSMLGYLYNEKEETAKCIDAYQKAIALRPDDTKTLYNLGELYYGVENYKKATTYYGELLKYDPKNSNLKANYAVCLWKNGESVKAKEILNQILELEEGNKFHNYNTVAWVLIDKDVDIEWGLKMALAANELKPNNIETVDILGWGYFKSKDYANAVKYLNISMKMQPSDEVKRRLEMAKEKLDESLKK